MARRFYRSSNDQQIAGVCAGLAHHLDLDPNLMRFFAVIVTIFTFGAPMLVVYLAAWAIFPERPTPTVDAT